MSKTTKTVEAFRDGLNDGLAGSRDNEAKYGPNVSAGEKVAAGILSGGIFTVLDFLSGGDGVSEDKSDEQKAYEAGRAQGEAGRK
jgi:hypothetical protein